MCTFIAQLFGPTAHANCIARALLWPLCSVSGNAGELPPPTVIAWNGRPTPLADSGRQWMAHVRSNLEDAIRLADQQANSSRARRPARWIQVQGVLADVHGKIVRRMPASATARLDNAVASSIRQMQAHAYCVETDDGLGVAMACGEVIVPEVEGRPKTGCSVAMQRANTLVVHPAKRIDQRLTQSLLQAILQLKLLDATASDSARARNEIACAESGDLRAPMREYAAELKCHLGPW